MPFLWPFQMSNEHLKFPNTTVYNIEILMHVKTDRYELCGL